MYTYSDGHNQRNNNTCSDGGHLTLLTRNPDRNSAAYFATLDADWLQGAHDNRRIKSMDAHKDYTAIFTLATISFIPSPKLFFITITYSFCLSPYISTLLLFHTCWRILFAYVGWDSVLFYFIFIFRDLMSFYDWHFEDRKASMFLALLTLLYISVFK